MMTENTLKKFIKIQKYVCFKENLTLTEPLGNINLPRLKYIEKHLKTRYIPPVKLIDHTITE